MADTNTASETQSEPVRPDGRIENLDVLRGIAIMGILMINIWVFAMPEAVLQLPNAFGSLAGDNGLFWRITNVFFQLKFITIFSMLFGAGIVLMAGAQRSPEADARHRRRMLWLALFGLMHILLIWFGDILLVYALCGLIAGRWRAMKPAKLMGVGLILLVLSTLLMVGLPMLINLAPPETLASISEKMTAQQAEGVATALSVYNGGYVEQLMHRLQTVPVLFAAEFAFFAPRTIGLMFFGMAFIKTGVLQGKKPVWLYGLMIVSGAVALYYIDGTARHMLAIDFAFPDYMAWGQAANMIGSLFVALGYMALVVLIGKVGFLRIIRYPFAAAGRMAFSNYIAQSLIATTLFYGWGLGWFGDVDRVGQVQLVWKIWVGLLVWSMLWLQVFRFGPLEWVWRSLTYGKFAPMFKSK
jgi:uncharacterized protein